MTITCVSCNGKYQKKNDNIRYTFRNGENLPLCSTCWDAALQVQNYLRVPSKAEAAKKRYELMKEIKE